MNKGIPHICNKDITQIVSKEASVSSYTNIKLDFYQKVLTQNYTEISSLSGSHQEYK